jgi:hypothetical protein
MNSALVSHPAEEASEQTFSRVKTGYDNDS